MVESECGDFVCVCSDCMLESLVLCSHSLGVKDLQLGDSSGLTDHHVLLSQIRCL